MSMEDFKNFFWKHVLQESSDAPSEKKAHKGKENGVSRRSVLKMIAALLGTATAGSFLAGCGPEQESIPASLDSLTWDVFPLDDLEHKGYLQSPPEEFGHDAQGKARFRRLVFKNKPTLLDAGIGATDTISSFIPKANKAEQQSEQAMVERFVREKIDKIIIIQERRIDANGNEIWVSLKVPGSRLHMQTSQFIAKNLDEYQMDSDKINSFVEWLKTYFAATQLPGDPREVATTIAKAQLLEAIFDPKVSDDDANAIITRFLYPNTPTLDPSIPASHEEWLKKSREYRQLFNDLPESMPIEMWLDVVRANNSPFGDHVFANLNGINYTEQTIIDTIMNHSGVGAHDCIVVPKKATKEANVELEEFYQEVKKHFIDIQKKPRVFKVLLEGGLSRLVVIDDMDSVDAFNRVVTEWDDRVNITNILNERNLKDGSNFQWLAVNEEQRPDGNTINVKNRIENLIPGMEGKIFGIEEYPQEAIEWILVPNKFLGMNKKRLTPGIIFTGHEQDDQYESPQEKKVLLLDQMLRDLKKPVQAMDQTKKETQLKNGTKQNWLTDVTEIIKRNIDKGIYQLYDEGLMSSLEFLARAMRGVEGSSFMEYPFLQLGDPFMAALLADMKMTDLFKNRGENPNSGVNMAVFLEDVEVVKLRFYDFYADEDKVKKFFGKIGIGTDSKIWEAFNEAVEKYSDGLVQDEVNEEKFTINERQVTMRQGDIFPVGEVIKVKGKKYLVFKELDNEGFSLDSLNSKDATFIAIPFEEVMKKVLIMDPDNNILEFLREAADLAMPILLTSMVLLPGPTGAAVTWAGKGIQKQIIKLLTSMGSKILKTAMKFGL